MIIRRHRNTKRTGPGACPLCAGHIPTAAGVPRSEEMHHDA